MQKSDCIIGVEHVSKFFGDKAVLNDVNLSVRKGEFVTILGPSGCGKTTLLRLIAGFQTASEGVITIAGKDITQTPPHKRPVNTVFQKYALFPHLNETRDSFCSVCAAYSKSKISSLFSRITKSLSKSSSMLFRKFWLSVSGFGIDAMGLFTWYSTACDNSLPPLRKSLAISSDAHGIVVLMDVHVGSSFNTVCRYLEVLAASSLKSTSLPSFDKTFTTLLMVNVFLCCF